MASVQHPTVYNDDDLDDDDENEPLDDVVLDEDDDDVVGEDSESDTDDADADGDTNSTSSPAAPPAPAPITSTVLHSSSVTLAIPAAVHHHNGTTTPPSSIVAVPSTKIASTGTTPEPKRQRIDDIVSIEKRPIDDSRRLFQRLWTDEDEIELLQGFLEYTAQRGMTSSGHHHDTTAFYDQIKSKLQLDFNKNQLVEKLRRLKKKYRNIVSRISSGKDFVFKSPHDQATFEISRKIWSNSAVAAAAAIMGRPDFDDDDQNPNPSLPLSYSNVTNSIGNVSVPDHHKALINIDVNTSSEKMMTMMSNPRAAARKRVRVKMEEKSPKNPAVVTAEGVNVNVAPSAGACSGAGAGGAGAISHMQGLIEETLKSCLSPLINNSVNGPVFGGNGGRGIGGLTLNAIPLNFAGLNLGINGELVDEKWRKQQILELEVYSKRLELVLDQIKLTLEYKGIAEFLGASSLFFEVDFGIMLQAFG
ncbi:hypothetical protein Dimus_012268 [Dionaea muscipula]